MKLFVEVIGNAPQRRRNCATFKDAGWLAATVTTGRSFGRDLETMILHTGLRTCSAPTSRWSRTRADVVVPALTG